jgi:hypothetical protein
MNKDNTWCTRRLQYEDVKKYFEDNGCKLLDTEYKNAKTKMKYICICNREAEICFDKFKCGKRCIKCKYENQSIQLRLPFEYLEKEFLDGNCKLLIDEKDYINARCKMKYICECGKIDEISYDSFKIGGRCQTCAAIKRRKTLFENGSAPVSCQQKYIQSSIGGILNYPVHTLSLDVAFPEQKIYLEFDGSGHDLNVKRGEKSREDFEKYEKARWYALNRRGWKEIRVVSKKDYLPTKHKVKEIYEYAVDFLNSGSSWICFDIDNLLVNSSSMSEFYEYGKLKAIRKSNFDK